MPLTFMVCLYTKFAYISLCESPKSTVGALVLDGGPHARSRDLTPKLHVKIWITYCLKDDKLYDYVTGEHNGIICSIYISQ